MVFDLLSGVTLQGPVTNLAAALVANAVAIYQVSNDPNQIGTKSVRLKKLMIRNNAAGPCWLSVGNGVGVLYADLIVPVRSQNNLDATWQTVELPGVESFADVTAWVDALVAGGSLDIQLEVEEVG